ncbi:hypothetical protein T265_08534 [Opisthorchis viverrini]|uniref:J domain-containing protein n=1 Tax=Opisthorchis viverrini TaxID=6198 RepID=A0A075A846_OPIVI|nr:hypothetical protein T265_08534 [Opisthorchis viverrini]KER23639.1 hypothetical protein T265_08534 [Opisthorchis viverrini]
MGSTYPSPAPVSTEVLQDSVLGPVLFLIYVNAPPGVLASLCLPLWTWSSNASAFRMDVDAAKQWSLDWHLPLDEGKCIHMSLEGDSANAFVVHGEKGPENIMRIDAKKDLGIWVSSNLSFSLHHEKQAQKAFAILRMIRRTSRITRMDFHILYGAYVRPVLEYANQVVHSGRTKDVTFIERFKRAATRMVAGLKPVDYETRLAMLDHSPLEYRRLRGELILTYALFEQILANRFCTVDPANTRLGYSERQPLTDKYKSDSGNLDNRVDPVYQSPEVPTGCGPMDSMEKSHALQSSVVSALFDARQLIWTELSSVISGRQLQSFYTGKPLCSTCSRDIALSDKLSTVKEHGRPTDKLSPHRARTYRTHFGGHSEARKRLRSNTSLSSSSPVSSAIGRGLGNAFPPRWDTKPAQKRHCTRESLGVIPSFPIVLVRDAQSLDEVDDDFHEKPAKRDSVSPAPLQKPSAVVGSVTSKKKPAATPKGQAFRMTEFSPPTQQYDASFAIENAVNHSDLAAVEITRLDSVASTAPYMRADTADEQESITLSMDIQQQTSKFVFRRPPSSRSRSRMVASQLLQRHRGLALRAHQNRRTVRAKHRQVSKRHSLTRNKRKDLDETTADASLPSDFLESEYSLRIPEVKPEMNSGISAPVPQLAGERTTELEECLPSLGGSPTAKDRQLFKRPEVPVAQTTSSSKPTQARKSQSVLNQVNDASCTWSQSGSISAPVPQLAGERTTELEECLPSLGGSPTAKDRQLFKRPEVPVAQTTSSSKPTQARKSQSVLNQVNDLETQLPSQYPESMDVPLLNQDHGIRDEEHPSSESLVSKEDKENRVPSVAQVALGSEAPGSRCEYYTSLGLSSPQVANRIHRCSKHRALHGSPPSTPKGFWDISIPDSEYPVKFEDSGKEQIRRLRRRHPLNFPDKSGPSTGAERVHRPDACLRDAGNQARNLQRWYATQTKVKDYYSVLQVKPTASQAEIKNAYLELSKKYHPDTAAPNSNSKSRFVDLTEAYSVLGKIESRQEYDAYRKLLDLGLVGDGFRMYYPKPSGELDAAALEAYQDEMRRYYSGFWLVFTLKTSAPSQIGTLLSFADSIAATVIAFLYKPAFGLTFDSSHSRWEDTFQNYFTDKDDAWKSRLLVRKLGTLKHDRFTNFILLNHPKDPYFAQTVKQLREIFVSAGIRYSLSKLEHEKDIAAKVLTTECQLLRNLKHDTAMVQQTSRLTNPSGVMALKRTTVTHGKKPPTS